MQKFYQYLQANGISPEADQAVLDRAKRDFRRQYQQNWREQNQAKWIRREVRFAPEQIEVIERQAAKHKLSFAEYLRSITEAYHKQMFVLPNPEVLQDIKLEIKRVGTNVNQQTYVINRSQSIPDGNYQQLKQQLDGLTEFVNQKLTRPDELGRLIHQAIKAHPGFADVLEDITKQYADQV